MIEADERVPVGAILGDREIQRRPRREHARPVGIVDLPFETDEEMRLVPDDRPADHAAVFPFRRRRLVEVVRSNEIVSRCQPVRRAVSEEDSLEFVGSGFRDRVDDRTARAAELRVVHAGDNLELLDRFQRSPDLRARARPQRIVGVVAAVDGDEIVLAGLARRDDGVVAHLVRGGELDARHQRDRRKVVAVHCGQLAQIVGPDITAHLRARRVDQRRLGGDRHGLLQ